MAVYIMLTLRSIGKQACSGYGCDLCFSLLPVDEPTQWFAYVGHACMYFKCPPTPHAFASLQCYVLYMPAAADAGAAQ